MCYTVLMWTLIISISYCYNHLIDKPVHYIPTDKINAFIRICIRISHIFKVKIANFDQFCRITNLSPK